ncbi:hypothetical protein L484_007655 [Morus notabilis]|uniref:Uncharacterized protein n=1 Tax=Morus notabilis TaxID=981085 RepID=W9RH48_9ROSA|nr:hypothetical protein L484_007655 [Morus notabilis]
MDRRNTCRRIRPNPFPKQRICSPWPILTKNEKNMDRIYSPASPRSNLTERVESPERMRRRGKKKKRRGWVRARVGGSGLKEAVVLQWTEGSGELRRRRRELR